MICCWWSTCWRSWCSGWGSPSCRWRRTWFGRAPHSASLFEPRRACCCVRSTSSCPIQCRSCSPAGWSPHCREIDFFIFPINPRFSFLLQFPTPLMLPDIERDGHQSVEDDDVGPEREEGGEGCVVSVWPWQEAGELWACVDLPKVVSYCQDGAHDH